MLRKMTFNFDEYYNGLSCTKIFSYDKLYAEPAFTSYNTSMPFAKSSASVAKWKFMRKYYK